MRDITEQLSKGIISAKPIAVYIIERRMDVNKSESELKEQLTALILQSVKCRSLVDKANSYAISEPIRRNPMRHFPMAGIENRFRTEACYDYSYIDEIYAITLFEGPSNI